MREELGDDLRLELAESFMRRPRWVGWLLPWGPAVRMVVVTSVSARFIRGGRRDR